jgi:hypothetical protein
VLRDGVNGVAVDFFSVKKLANRIESVLAQRRNLGAIRAAARATAVERFDLNGVLLPRWLELFDTLMNGRTPVTATATPARPKLRVVQP